MNEEHYNKWNLFSPIGLLVIGLGLSVIGDATYAKVKGKPWILKGTIGLILFNAGVAFFGEAVKARALYEWELKQDTEK